MAWAELLSLLRWQEKNNCFKVRGLSQYVNCFKNYFHMFLWIVASEHTSCRSWHDFVLNLVISWTTCFVKGTRNTFKNIFFKAKRLSQCVKIMFSFTTHMRWHCLEAQLTLTIPLLKSPKVMSPDASVEAREMSDLVLPLAMPFGHIRRTQSLVSSWEECCDTFRRS